MINIGIGVAWATRKVFNAVTGIIFSFKARVAADGGTFEAQACLAATLTYLNSIFSALGIAKLFQSRVTLDSGTYEAQDCQVAFINNLNNI